MYALLNIQHGTIYSIEQIRKHKSLQCIFCFEWSAVNWMVNTNISHHVFQNKLLLILHQRQFTACDKLQHSAFYYTGMLSIHFWIVLCCFRKYCVCSNHQIILNMHHYWKWLCTVLYSYTLVPVRNAFYSVCCNCMSTDSVMAAALVRFWTYTAQHNVIQSGGDHVLHNTFGKQVTQQQVKLNEIKGQENNDTSLKYRIMLRKWHCRIHKERMTLVCSFIMETGSELELYSRGHALCWWRGVMSWAGLTHHESGIIYFVMLSVLDVMKIWWNRL